MHRFHETVELYASILSLKIWHLVRLTLDVKLAMNGWVVPQGSVLGRKARQAVVLGRTDVEVYEQPVLENSSEHPLVVS